LNKKHKKRRKKLLHQNPRSDKSLSNDWWTPDKLYKRLCKYYKIKPKLDVSATARNSKCDWYLGRRANALSLDTKWIIPKKRRVAIWLNPPNEFLQDFFFRTYLEWVDSNCKQEIIMIVPTNSMSSQGFWINVQYPIDFGENVSYRAIEGRPEFLDDGKKPDSSARNAYISIVFGIEDPHPQASMISLKS